MLSTPSTDLLRLLLSPALIGAASIAARFWGPEAGGWLAALPLTSGPVVLVLSLEHGTTFAADACVGIVLAVIALAGYAVVYSRVSRAWGPLSSAAIACTVYLAAIWPLARLRVSLVTGFALACAAMVVAYRLLPREQLAAQKRAPSWDIPLRVVLAAMLVLALGQLAVVVGSRASGLLAPFPVAVTIMSTFTHRNDGAGAARRFLRSLIGGLVSFAVFFLAAGALLPSFGTWPALAAATAAALATHAIGWRMTLRSRAVLAVPTSPISPFE